MPTKPIDAMTRALKLLAGREKSRAQLEAALVAKGHTAEEIAGAVKRCQELGYLDDDRAGKDLAAKLLAQGRSQIDVERRLEAKGFDPAAANALKPDDRAAAKQLLKDRGLTGVKAARLLLSRGFDQELVESLVELPDVD
jgi:regulatory protein